MLPVPDGSDLREWIALDHDPLPIDAASSWVTGPGTGAVVAFAGTVRDHADGRDGVVALEYEAFEDGALGAMARIAAQAREAWPDLGRIVLLHRLGRIELEGVSVLVVVSAPHRGVAFEAARYCIDTLKASVPIWKKEHWAGGVSWGTRAHPIERVRSAAEPGVPGPVSGSTSAAEPAR